MNIGWRKDDINEKNNDANDMFMLGRLWLAG